MTNYGKNFEFRTQPDGANRSGRYYLTGSTNIPIGAPVKYDSNEDENALGLLPVTLATGDQARPLPGMGGILVYEHAPAAFAGVDPFLTTYSDIDTAPYGKAVIVVSGDDVKVVLRNTSATTFLNTRSYAGRTMVTGIGATPTLVVGNYLTPGTGNDSAGYWAETSTEANAWLVVTKVDLARGEVEARFV
jgi:hypothetical protein